VDKREIDGGLEFNGFYMYDPHYEYAARRSWWWVQGDTYRVCFGAPAGYRVVREYTYSHWLPSRVGKVVVAKRGFVN
jgi:hypothetical protein